MAIAPSSTPAPPPPDPDRIEHEVIDGILVVRLLHEGRANALTERMLSSLTKLLAAQPYPDIRAAILTGAGDRHFSGGAELGSDAVLDWSNRIRRIEHGIQDVAGAIQKSSFPVIAALNGDAIGGGLELAMTCDWRVGRDGIRLGMPPARLGLVYTADGLRRFADEIGMARTRELFLTGRFIDARAARDIGLVNHVTSADELLPVALRMGQAIAANAPMAVEGMRVVLRAILDDDTPDAKAQQWRVRTFGSQDLAEGVAAARERRQPQFRGQ